METIKTDEDNARLQICVAELAHEERKITKMPLLNVTLVVSFAVRLNDLGRTIRKRRAMSWFPARKADGRGQENSIGCVQKRHSQRIL
jgi:hypothetical protein